MRRSARAASILVVFVSVAAAVAGESVDEFIARHWRTPLAPQGPAPARFSPLEASLEPEACGTCHPAQYADWRTSLHAASFGPGVAGQHAELLAADPAAAIACQDCHAPLAEQKSLAPGDGRFVANPVYQPALRARGVVCAACHVRGNERFAPPPRDGGRATTAPGAFPPHNGVTRSPAFLRSEFCRGCHQFAPGALALEGTLVQNTYEEWRASRFARAGKQCQDCHMPDRRHRWRGIHDEAMVRSGVTIDADATPETITLRVRNTGVGHAFPTYVTPLVVLRADTLEADRTPVAGARVERLIGRRVTLDLTRQLDDTRLPPDAETTLAYARPRAPRSARLSVVVYPDAFYTEFFETLLRQGAGRGEAQIREALAAARRSAFTLFARDVAGR